jgi:[ribosomal protein S5]-alanine N-acetyltransferase
MSRNTGARGYREAAMIAGTWSGVLDVGSACLRLKVTVGEDGSATLFSLDRDGLPIPGKIAGERVEIEFPSRRAAFVGRMVSSDRIDGLWLQNGRDFPLLFERGEAALANLPPPRDLSGDRLATLRAEAGAPVMLETDRLWLRDVRASDIDAFQAYMHPEPYWRHSPIDPPTPESVAALVSNFLRSQAQKPRLDYFLAAVDKRSDEFVGEACLRVRGVSSRQGAVGWGVVDGKTGRGFATEIGRELLRLAFETLDLHRVDAQCRAQNHASRRIMAKIGMREEGVWRDNLFVRGEWWSTVQCAILATDRML